MKLSVLCESIKMFSCGMDPEIHGLTLDSRYAKAGDLFALCGVVGMAVETYLSEAIHKGVSAILYDSHALRLEGSLLKNDLPIIGVPQLRQYLGSIADKFYAHPSHHMPVFGVTGTNGKSSITQYISQALTYLHSPCAVLGTLGNGFLPHLEKTTHTTLNAFHLQALLAQYRDQGAQGAAIEVSSHGLDQGRVNGIQFDTAIFSNLTRDHLDYHHSMAAYGAAKEKLFTMPDLKHAIINYDDMFGRTLLTRLSPQVEGIAYSLDTKVGDDLRYPLISVQEAVYHETGFSAEIVTPKAVFSIETSLFGDFNLSNILPVIALLQMKGYSTAAIQEAVGALTPVNGRMSLVSIAAPFQIMIDYAHTPDALKQVLIAIKKHIGGRLWCIFGCGGNRDKGKRPEMGRIVETYADEWIITNDNPRDEPPQAIAEDILSGMMRPDACTLILDRKEAIFFALSVAKAGDLVLIAGKGHETEQEIAKQKYPFSDLETVETFFHPLHKEIK